jgi:tRNA pseudouridine55 synthase
VRALADDLGRALGTVAHLAALRRTAVGAFNENFAQTLPALEAAAEDGTLASLVVDPAVAMAPVGTRALGADEAAALAVGRSLAPSGTDRPVAALGPDGHLVGVIQDVGGHARPRVVLG